MRFVFVLCLVALSLAVQEKGRTFTLFKATKYFKAHAALSTSCYNNKFEGEACKKAFTSFSSVAIKADGNKYFKTDYCMKHTSLCTKCANNWHSVFFSRICNKSKDALLSLYTVKAKKVTVQTKKEPVQTFPDLKEGLAQDPMAFYKAVSVGKGKPVIELGTTGVSLYDGLPWESNGKAFELNNDRVKEYEKAILGKDTSFSIAQDNYCQKTNQDIDGVLSADVAALPILAFREIDDAGVPLNWNQNTRPRKLAAILKRKSDGVRFFLPCTCTPNGDAKGHTWPGGVAQTFLSNDRQKKNAWKFNNDGGHITGSIINTTVTSLSAIRSGYSSVKYHWKSNGEMKAGAVGISISLELHNKFFTPLTKTKTYQLDGFVGWKE